MPVTYEISTPHKLVVSHACGTLTLPMLVAYVQRLQADPDFDPGMDQVFDFTSADTSVLTSHDMRQMASRNVFAEGSRRVFITPPGLTFGLGRAFASYIEGLGQDITLVHTRAEASAFLQLAEAELPNP